MLFELSFSYREKTNEFDHVVLRNSTQGCSSAVGKHRGEQELSLKPNCIWNNDGKPHGTIIHEFIHALGFYHEQQRSDRDEYIELNTGNIWDYSSYRIYDDTTHFNVPYDGRSIMHYSTSQAVSNLLKPAFVSKVCTYIFDFYSSYCYSIKACPKKQI